MSHLHQPTAYCQAASAVLCPPAVALVAPPTPTPGRSPWAAGCGLSAIPGAFHLCRAPFPGVCLCGVGPGRRMRRSAEGRRVLREPRWASDQKGQSLLSATPLEETVNAPSSWSFSYSNSKETERRCRRGLPVKDGQAHLVSCSLCSLK